MKLSVLPREPPPMMYVEDGYEREREVNGIDVLLGSMKIKGMKDMQSSYETLPNQYHSPKRIANTCDLGDNQ